MPVRNAAQWLDETFRSLMEQSIENIHVELSIYNDGSSASAFSFCFLIQFYFCEEQDNTLNIIEQWRKRLESKYRLIINGHDDEEARGGEK